jgi:hypothetical protein
MRTLPIMIAVVSVMGALWGCQLSSSASPSSLTPGSTWTTRTLPSSADWWSVTYGNGTFVAVAVGPSNAAATSPDGVNWTARNLPSTDYWDSVTYADGTFVAVAIGSDAATSP